MKWEDCEYQDCMANIDDCEDCVDGDKYTEDCPNETDCMADRDFCCDCCKGDKYLSPDSYERED